MAAAGDHATGDASPVPGAGDDGASSPTDAGPRGPVPRLAKPSRVSALRLDSPASSGRRSGRSTGRTPPRVRLPASPVTWPSVSADFLVNLVEPPRTVTMVVRPKIQDTMKELAPMLGLKPSAMHPSRVRVRESSRAGGSGENITGNFQWEATIRKFWETRTSREEAAAVSRLQELTASVNNGVDEAKQSGEGVSSATAAVEELWEWSTRHQFHHHFLQLGVVHALCRVLTTPPLVAAHAPAVAILSAFALAERCTMLLGQQRVVECITARLEEQHAVRRAKLEKHAANEARRGRRNSGAGLATPTQPVVPTLPVRGVNEEIIMLLDYCAAAFMNCLVSHAQGRALVYSTGSIAVRLLEMLVGSRELATASLAIDAACFLTAMSGNNAWYPRGLFNSYKRSLTLLGDCKLRAAMHHVYEWMGPDNTTDTNVLRLELAAASVTNSLALTQAGITVLRAANLLPMLARVWTRVHDHLAAEHHDGDETQTLLDDAVMQAARTMPVKRKTDAAGTARLAKILAKSGGAAAAVGLSTVAWMATLKTGAARQQHVHRQHVRILEHLSGALWACAVGGIDDGDVTKPGGPSHWTLLNVVKLAVMMMDESDKKVATAGMGLLANACSYQLDDNDLFGQPRPYTRPVSPVTASDPRTGRDTSPPPRLQTRNSIRFADSTLTIGDGGGAASGKTKARDGASTSRSSRKGSRPRTAASDNFMHAPTLEGVYARAQEVELSRPVRRFLSDHACRALMRRAREESGDKRCMFVAVSAINQLAATGGRTVQLELWRSGVASFVIEALGVCYEHMASVARATAAHAMDEVEAEEAKEQAKIKAAEDAKAAELARRRGATVAQSPDARSKRGRGAPLPQVRKRSDASEEGQGAGAATTAKRILSRSLIKAGSHRNLPASFRDLRKEMHRTAKTVVKAPSDTLGEALRLDAKSVIMLRHIASACMGLARCYGSRRSQHFVETVVCLLRHPDPLVLRYGIIATWALAHDRHNRRDVARVGAMVLLLKWASLTLLTAAASDKVREEVRQQGLELPLGPDYERRAKNEVRMRGASSRTMRVSFENTTPVAFPKTPNATARSAGARGGREADGVVEEEVVEAARRRAERDQAADLLALNIGCTWLLCCGVEDNVVLFLEHGGLELVADVLRNGTASPRMLGPLHVALGLVWTLCDLPYVRGRVVSQDHGIPELVFQLVFGESTTPIKPEIRVRAAGFLLDILRDTEVRNRLGDAHGGGNFMEQLWTDMLSSPETGPREYAIRTVATAAKSRRSKLKLLHEGGVKRLVGYLRDFVEDPVMMDDSLMLALLHGLLNLSTEPEVQEYLGRRCLNIIMALAEDNSRRELQAFAARIVLNLRRNPLNITRIYVKELKAKERLWKESSLDWKQAVPRPPLARSPFTTFNRPAAATEFMDWFNSSITESRGLPHSHPPDSIAFLSHNTSPWMERSLLSLPSITVGSMSSTVPRQVRRSTAPTFQRSMCSSITDIWTPEGDQEKVSLAELGHKSTRASVRRMGGVRPSTADLQEEAELRGEVQPRKGRRASLFELSSGKLEESALAAAAAGGDSPSAAITSGSLAASQSMASLPKLTPKPSKFGDMGMMAKSLANLKAAAKEEARRNHQSAATLPVALGSGGGGKSPASKWPRMSADSAAIEADMAKVLQASRGVGPDAQQASVMATYLETVPRYWRPKIHSYKVSAGGGSSKPEAVTDPSDPTVPVLVVMEPRTSRHRVKFMPKARSVARAKAEAKWQAELATLTKKGGAKLSSEQQRKKLRAKKRANRDKPWRANMTKRPPMSPLPGKKRGGRKTEVDTGSPRPTGDEAGSTRGSRAGSVADGTSEAAALTARSGASEESLGLPPPNKFEPSVRLARFEHIPGCKVCKGMYKHYTLPDGRMVHYYHDDSLNELVLDHVVTPPSYPLALGDIGLVTGFPPPPDALRPIESDMPVKYVPQRPIGTPQPRSVSLPAPERLLFEVNAVPQEQAPPPPPEAPKKEWSLYDSVFRPRLKESYARSFYDDGRANIDAFEVDWRRVMGKRGLIRAVAQAGAKGVDVGRDSLDVLKNTVRHFYEYISALFDYYAVLGDGFHFAIRSNAFNDFVRVSRLTEEPTGNERKGSIVLDMHQFEIIWTSCIFQDAATKKEGLNMEGQMMRFEFMEFLVRAAIRKFLNKPSGERQCASMSEAFEKMFKEHILPRQPPDALVDKDEFRRTRLYNEGVDLVLKANKRALRNIFTMLTKETFIRKRRYVMDMDTWLNYMRRVNIIDNDAIACSNQDAQLAFTWAKMGVRDELGDQFDWITLTFTDFLEALGRVADCTAMPTDSDLAVTHTENAFEFFTEIRPKPELRRASASELLGVKKRLLAPKLARLMEYLLPMTLRAYKLPPKFFEQASDDR